MSAKPEDLSSLAPSTKDGIVRDFERRISEEIEQRLAQRAEREQREIIRDGLDLPEDVPKNAALESEEPRFERMPKDRAPIVAITITVTEDLPGGLPNVPDFTAALLMTIKLATMHGGREIQLHHVRAGYESDPHVMTDECTCRPLAFRVEAPSKIIIPVKA